MHEILKDKSVVFFDVGYTINRPASGDWMLTEKFREIAGERLARCSSEDLIRARAVGLEYLEKNHLMFTEEEEAECFGRYYRILSDVMGLGLTEKETSAIAADRTYNMDNYEIYPDAKEVLEKLSEKYALGVISDTWPSIENTLRTLGVRKYFSFTTYSCSLGTYKPDPRMYLDALGKCGKDAGETLFIDDNPANLEGAAKLGITPVLIAANPESDVDVPYLKIYSLSELLKGEKEAESP